MKLRHENKAASPLPAGEAEEVEVEAGFIPAVTAGYTPTKSAMRSIGPPGQQAKLARGFGTEPHLSDGNCWSNFLAE